MPDKQMIEILSSPSNSKVKHVSSIVSSKKYRNKYRSFVVEGFKAVLDVLENQSDKYRVKEVFVSSKVVCEPQIQKYLKLCSTIYQLPPDVFAKISDVVNSQGVLARVEYKKTDFSIKQSGKYLLLDSINDPGNLGTMIRTSVAAGFDGVLLYGATVELYNPKTIRSTMGTFKAIDIFNIDKDAVIDIKDNGYDIVTTIVDGQESVFEAEFSDKTVLVIGSEANGVSSSIQELATRSITIPMNKDCESLNAAVAAGICMFHIS